MTGACIAREVATDSRLRERAAGDRGAGGERARRRRGARPRARRPRGTRRRLRDRRRRQAGGRGRAGGRRGSHFPRGGERPPGPAPPHEAGAASLAEGGAARPSGRLPPPRDDARAGAGAGDPAPGGHARWPRPGAVREARQEPRGIPHEIRGHALGHADGGGARADRLRVRAGRGGRRASLCGSALLAAPAPARAHPGAGDRGPARRDQARRSGDGHQGRADRVRHPHAGARGVPGAGARRGGLPDGGCRGVRSGGRRAGLPGARPCGRVRVRGAAWHGVHVPRRGGGRTGFHPPGAAPVRGPADRPRHSAWGRSRAARVRHRAQDPARDVPHVEPAHPHGGLTRRASVQAVSRPGRGRDVEHRRAAGGRHLAHRRVFRRPERVGPDQGGPRARRAQRVRERVSSGVREGGVGVPCAERIGGSLVSLRRTVAAFVVLLVPFGQTLFTQLGDFVKAILGFSYKGSEFVFGELGKQHSSLGIVFAFQVLPAIIFVSALFAILYYLGVMQLVVKAFAIAMNKVMRASGAESLNVAASIFMGQTEAPLTIRPFLPGMTRSELMTVMTAGMAHVSGSIMAAYIAMGIEARHLLTAVIMTAPGTIMMAKIIEPETETPQTLGGVRVEIPRTDVNIVDAAARGTTDGLHLMLNVIAMLVSFVALVALLNGAFGWVHGYVTWFPESIQTVLGWVFRPIAFAMGVPWHDSGTIGGLLGTRMVLNEFLAYAQLGPMRAQLDPVSFTIATFALCGFANISSVGIQIGGIGALVPDRKHDLARLGFRAMIAGTLANFLSAT